MAIRTNMKSLAPRRQAYSRKIVLPSHGYTNRQAWPGGELVVYPWDSSIDEFVLQAVKRMPNAQVVSQLIERVCNLNGGNVDDMIAAETPAILLASRAFGASNTGQVEYQTKCPGCGAAEKSTIHIPDELGILGEKPEDYPGYDTIVLPSCQDRVDIRPLKLGDEKLIFDQKNQGSKYTESLLKTMLAVVSVNSSQADNLDEMARWCEALAPEDIDFLEKEQMRITPRLNTAIDHVCDSCGREFVHTLVFQMEFFRASSAPKPGGALEKDVRPGAR